jgi:hypothetical protein
LLHCCCCCGWLALLCQHCMCEGQRSSFCHLPQPDASVAERVGEVECKPTGCDAWKVHRATATAVKRCGTAAGANLLSLL